MTRLAALLALVLLLGGCSSGPGRAPGSDSPAQSTSTPDRLDAVQAQCDDVTSEIDADGSVLPGREIVQRQTAANGFSAPEVEACIAGVRAARAGCEEPDFATPAYAEFVDCIVARR